MSFQAENNVLQLYENNGINQSIWVMGFSNWMDFFTKNGAAISGDGISTTVTADGQVRMNVTSIPVGEIKNAGNGNFLKGLELATKDLAEALERRHLYSPKDYRNVEVTGYVDVIDESSNSNNRGIVWYGPSGRHTGNMQDPPHDDTRGCWGATYKTNYNTKDNKIRVQKESWHVNYDMRAWEELDESFGTLKKRGVKHVNFIFERNGKLGRRIESWIDVKGIDSNNRPKNKWKLVRIEEDHPDLEHWGTEMLRCKCASNHQIILWAAPLVTYRWDFSRIKLSHGTVQEINPPTDGNFHQLDDEIEE